MGTTEKLFRTHFFFPDVLDPSKDLAPSALSFPQKVFRGYFGCHHYTSYGYAEVMADTVDGNLVGISFGVKGNNTHFLQTTGRYRKESADLEEIVLCRKPEGGGEFPVHLLNADVLPWIEPGTVIFGQSMAYAVTLELYPDRLSLLNHFSPVLRDVYAPAEGTILMETVGNGGIASVWGRIVRWGRLPVTRRVLGSPHPGLPYFELETNIGRITFIVPTQKVLENGFLEKIQSEGSYVYTQFLLTLDVAIGEYQKGAVKDEEHLLRVLGDALARGRIPRLGANLSEDCLFFYNGETLTGKAETLAFLRRTFGEEHPGDVTRVFLGEVEKTGEGAVFAEGKKCLILASDKAKRLLGFAVVDLDEENLIDWIEITGDLAAYRVKVLDPLSVRTNGVSLEEAKAVTLKSASEWAKILYDDIKKGDTSHRSELYSSMIEKVHFNLPSLTVTGRDNVYGFLQMELEEMRRRDGKLEKRGDFVVQHCFSSDILLLVLTDGAGRILGFKEKTLPRPSASRTEEDGKIHEEVLLKVKETLETLDEERLRPYLSEDFLFDTPFSFTCFEKEGFLAYLHEVFPRLREKGKIEVVYANDPYSRKRLLLVSLPSQDPFSLRMEVKDGQIRRLYLEWW